MLGYQQNLNGIIGIGLNQLRANMENSPSAQEVLDALQGAVRASPEEKTKIYDSKNDYFRGANRIGGLLRTSDDLWAAEIYYNKILEDILRFEAESNPRKVFNKGMIYAVLGIVEMRLGKFDSGMAHLLSTNVEDKDFEKGFDITRTDLYKQFEIEILDDLWTYYSGLGSNLGIDRPFLDKFVSELAEVENRVFFVGTWKAISHHQSLIRRDPNSAAPNSFSLGRLFSALKDICLLTETLLRHNQIATGMITVTPHKELGALLENAINGQGFDLKNIVVSANSLEFFLRRLEELANEQVSERRWLCYLLLVRNFTGHHFDVSDTILSPSGKTFFPELYGMALQNVVLGLLYLRHIGSFRLPAT